MALKKCRECGREVSSSAKICPGCGINSPARSRAEVISGVVFAVIFLVAFIAWVNSGDEKPQPPNQHGGRVESGTASVHSTPPVQKTDEELRSEKIRSGFSLWDGSHIGLEKIIKQAMHNPNSYEHVKTTYKEKGDALIVATEYRGTNGFGGTVTNRVVAKTDLDGNVLKIISEGN